MKGSSRHRVEKNRVGGMNGPPPGHLTRGLMPLGARWAGVQVHRAHL